MYSKQNGHSKHSFDADTEDSEIKAPRPRPMQCQELPPQFKLEETDLEYDFRQKLCLEERERLSVQRKGSLDMHFSILGFINRKIRQKSRQRIMSQEIINTKI